MNPRQSTQVNPSHKVYLVVPVGLLPFGLFPFCLLTPNSGVSPTLKNDMKDSDSEWANHKPECISKYYQVLYLQMLDVSCGEFA